MSEIARMLDQFDRAYDGEPWSGPSLRATLAGVPAAVAAARPIAAAHTIWELVLHVAAWKDVVRRWLLGEVYELADQDNFPRVGDADEPSWAAALAALEAGHRALRAAIAGFDESRLDTPLGPNRSSPYVLVHGVIQHDLYHAGQIAVLRKGRSA